MIITSGHQQAAFALQDPETGDIALALVCEFENEARELRRQMFIHQPHKPRPRVVPVLVTITRLDV